MHCRFCNAELSNKFLDLGFQPPSNNYLTAEMLKRGETYFPLRLHVCSACKLVQTEDYTAADDVFTKEYAYFSSTSSSWLLHAATYAQEITERLCLNSKSFVVEIASNDGYLLKNFVNSKIPCLGIEPTASTAKAARECGVDTIEEFFTYSLANEISTQFQKADLIIGNNVYAHVPDINDFTSGLAAMLSPDGIITLEFPHLLETVRNNQFDTVYHEHFSYLSLHVVKKIFNAHGLKIIDVEKIRTHGGSLRIFGAHEKSFHRITDNVEEILSEESLNGLLSQNFYDGFQGIANSIKMSFLSFLIDCKKKNLRVAAYGAAAKGNTLINFCGIKLDLIECVFDAAVSKQGKFLPGSHIPILPPELIQDQYYDYIIILPWNLQHEIISQIGGLQEKGTRFVVFVPSFKEL